MKKTLIAVTALALLFTSCKSADVKKQQTPNLSEVKGKYEALFPAWRVTEYNKIWEEALKNYADVHAENASSVKDTFLSTYEAEIYGTDAVEKVKTNPSYFAFKCDFTDEIKTFTFDGNTIHGEDENGKTVFSHNYKYLKTLKADFGPKNADYAAFLSDEDWPRFDIYESDSPSDEYKYFAMGGDTPAETYHIEFRYGDNPEELVCYYEGKYAYWMASGVLKDCDKEMMKNVINLFAEENADTIRAIAGTN